jgi:hypothetical protein
MTSDGLSNDDKRFVVGSCFNETQLLPARTAAFGAKDDRITPNNAPPSDNASSVQFGDILNVVAPILIHSAKKERFVASLTTIVSSVLPAQLQSLPLSGRKDLNKGVMSRNDSFLL